MWFSFVCEDVNSQGDIVLPKCIDNIVKLFDKYNIQYRIDNNADSCNDISNFEKKIGRSSDVIVLVFSDKYFRSLHCMYEFVQIRSALKKYPKRCLLCVKSGDVDLSDPNYLLELEHYWGNIKQEYETLSFTILGILNALLGDKYKVLVAILGAECANEEDNAV
ncbi:MAG: hypothetical protein IKS00_04995 [Bacteroidales bacterium]|nr:hypothetical protein [Bacteroidales bacterium]